MTDPKENKPQAENNDKQNTDRQNTEQRPSSAENTNWDSHQQIDEEGNEVGPDDIK